MTYMGRDRSDTHGGIGMAIGSHTNRPVIASQNLQAPGTAAGGSSRAPSPLEKLWAGRAQATRAAAGGAPPRTSARGAAARSLASDGDFVSISLGDSPSGSQGLAAGQDFREGPSLRHPSGIIAFDGRHTRDLPKATRVLWKGAMRQSWGRLVGCGIAALLLFANIFMSVGLALCQAKGKKGVETGVWVWLWGSLGLFLLVLFVFGFLWWRDGKAVNKLAENEAWIGGKATGGVGASQALTLSTPAETSAAAAEAERGKGAAVGAGKREGEGRGKGKGKEVVKSVPRRSLLELDSLEHGKPVESSGEGTRGLGCRSDTQHSIWSEMGTTAPQPYSPFGVHYQEPTRR